MKTIWIRVLQVMALWALVQPAGAQQPSAAAPHPPLWKIEGKRATVFLLGSVHLLTPADYPLAAPIEAAFDRAKVVAFEADLASLNSPQLQAKVMTNMMLPAGQTIRDQLSPKLYDQLVPQLKATGLPLEAVERMKPGMLGMTLSMMELQKTGLDEKLGVDRHFYERAGKAGKETMGLEAAEFQVDLICSLSKEEGEALLAGLLKELPRMKEELDRLMQAWRKGDIKTTAELLNSALAEHPGLYKRFVQDRNLRWLPKVEELIRGDRDALVIVGTGHLAGKESLVELLQHKGIKVTQQ